MHFLRTTRKQQQTLRMVRMLCRDEKIVSGTKHVTYSPPPAVNQTSDEEMETKSFAHPVSLLSAEEIEEKTYRHLLDELGSKSNKLTHTSIC